MKTNLGKIKKIADLRSVWAHEEYDFSRWLSEEENLALLSDAIGIDIVLEELESAVGGFSVDLYASEEGTGRGMRYMEFAPMIEKGKVSALN